MQLTLLEFLRFTESYLLCLPEGRNENQNVDIDYLEVLLQRMKSLRKKGKQVPQVLHSANDGPKPPFGGELRMEGR